MNEKQKELLNKLLSMPINTVLKKGSRQRIVVGFNGFMFFYKTKENSKHTTGQKTLNFIKWAEKAEIL